MVVADGSLPPGVLFPARVRDWLRSVVARMSCNPYETGHAERLSALTPPDDVVDVVTSPLDPVPVLRLRRCLRSVLDRARLRLVGGCSPDQDARRLYEEACILLLSDQHGAALDPFIDPKPGALPAAVEKTPKGKSSRNESDAPAPRSLPREVRAAQAAAFAAFLADFEAFLIWPGSWFTSTLPDVLYERTFQVRRLRHYSTTGLVGTSVPMDDLRAHIFRSVATTNLLGFLRRPDDMIDLMTVLILGASGTGKEGIARAIGRSGRIRLLPAEGCFAAADGEHYHCINLVERSTLIEGELFGHEKGAFTGAERARPGLFERLQPGGALFLDEMGELPLGFQAKLLRVLQERTVQRLGGHEVRNVPGRMLAATNRDLPAMIAAGDFRNDLYQRVCTVELKPPTLQVQLKDKPSDLGLMALHIAVKMHGPDEGAALAERAMPILLRKLHANYGWPGNFRELERLVHRSLLQSTAPSTRRPTDTPVTGLVDAIAAGHTTWDAVEREVVTEVFVRTDSFRKGAEMLGMSRPRFKGLLQKSKTDTPRKKPPRGKRTGQRGTPRKGAGAGAAPASGPTGPGGDPTADTRAPRRG